MSAAAKLTAAQCRALRQVARGLRAGTWAASDLLRSRTGRALLSRDLLRVVGTSVLELTDAGRAALARCPEAAQ